MINRNELQLPSIQGGGLDNPFTEEEIWNAIKAMPPEKAPGPDGFNDIFFRACWSTIKHDILAAFHQFHHLAGDFKPLNKALVALLPKKDGAETIADYRPISLIHSVAKLIAKVLQFRLSQLIS